MHPSTHRRRPGGAYRWTVAVVAVVTLPVIAGAPYAGASPRRGPATDRPATSVRTAPAIPRVRALVDSGLRRVSTGATGTDPAGPQPSTLHRVGGALPHTFTAPGGGPGAASGSSNWSGQVLTGGSTTGVAGDWTVPAVVPSTGAQYSATWIGIDGTSPSGTLIQTGTEQSTVDGTTSYSAWVEELPDASVPIDAEVEPGDAMQSTVVETSADVWTVTLIDVTGSWEFSQPFAYTTPGASAEWIEEAPTVGGGQSTLADFSSATFTSMGVDATGGQTLDPVYLINPAGTAFVAWPGAYDPSSASYTDHYGTPPPTLASLSPVQGGTDGGTVVQISGQFLYATTAVHFGATSAAFHYDDSGTLTAFAPTRAAGTVDVTVTSAGGTSAVSGADRFTYVQSPPVGSGGYDMVGSDGGVFVFGGGFHGSLPGLGIHVDDVTGIVPTTAETGYFLVGADGGVFAFDAPFENSLPGIGVHVDDIVGIVPTLDDQGYFLVGADGGVFAFDAPFENSLPGIGVHVDDIVGIATTPDDQGYWVLGSDGSVYAFGDATSYGSAPGGAVAITATRDGGGYWVVGANGSVTAFGDARGYGDLPGLGVPVDDIVAIVVSPDSGGYDLFGRDGGVFSFGDAPDLGSLPGLGVVVSNVVGAVPT